MTQNYTKLQILLLLKQVRKLELKFLTIISTKIDFTKVEPCPTYQSIVMRCLEMTFGDRLRRSRWIPFSTCYLPNKPNL